MKKNILICTDSMGIGGVETAIYNQISAMIKKGHSVVLASRKGIYTEKVEKLGATVEDFDFTLENNFNFKKIDEMIKIVEKYGINEIHVEKYMCILTMFPVCMIKNIPYVAYIHDELNATYDWYIYNYDIYEILFREYFHYANKIVAIKKDVIDYTSKRFNVELSKYKLINNSISFSLLGEAQPVQNIKKFLLISRLDEEKLQSVKNAIVFFIKYCDTTNKEASLSILGDGNFYDEIKQFVKNKNIKEYDINFLGQSSDVPSVISEHDVVLGMGRCIIETIAMKRLAIVSGYEEISGIITQNNIMDMMDTNFNGKNLRKETLDDMIKNISNLSADEINKIVVYNYEFAFKKLNIDNNIYIMDDNEQFTVTTRDCINEIIMFQDRYINKKEQAISFEKDVYELRNISDRQYNKINELYEKIQKDWDERNKIIEDMKNNYEKIVETLNNKNTELSEEKDRIEDELNKVYNSKRWKLMQKILKFKK